MARTPQSGQSQLPRVTVHELIAKIDKLKTHHIILPVIIESMYFPKMYIPPPVIENEARARAPGPPIAHPTAPVVCEVNFSLFHLPPTQAPILGSDHTYPQRCLFGSCQGHTAR